VEQLEDKNNMSFLERFERELYAPVIMSVLLILLCIIFVFPPGLPLPISEQVKGVYEDMNALPPNSYIMMYGPTSPGHYPETGYMFEAIFRYAMMNDHKVLIFSGGADTTPTYRLAIENTKRDLVDKVYGEDWVYMGFTLAVEAECVIIAEKGIRAWKTLDYFDNPIDSLPMMEGIDEINDFQQIWTFPSSPQTTEAFVRQFGTRYTEGTMYAGAEGILAASTKSFSPDPFKYVLVSQRSTAELEYIIGRPGITIASMDAMSVLLLSFIIVAILGNIIGRIVKSEGGM
jgi:hypothetical protein